MTIIKFFNTVSVELFQAISELKYSVEHMEINLEEKLVCFNIITQNFNICIVIFYFTHEHYKTDMNCSVSFYERSDLEMDKPKYYMLNHSIQECADFIVEQDLIEMISNPAFCRN